MDAVSIKKSISVREYMVTASADSFVFIKYFISQNKNMCVQVTYRNPMFGRTFYINVMVNFLGPIHESVNETQCMRHNFF